MNAVDNNCNGESRALIITGQVRTVTGLRVVRRNHEHRKKKAELKRDRVIRRDTQGRNSSQSRMIQYCREKLASGLHFKNLEGPDRSSTHPRPTLTFVSLGFKLICSAVNGAFSFLLPSCSWMHAWPALLGIKKLEHETSALRLCGLFFGPISRSPCETFKSRQNQNTW